MAVNGEYGNSLLKLINDNNIKYSVTYSKAGTIDKGPLETSMVPGYNENTKEIQNLTVTYTDTDTNIFAANNTATTTLTVTLLNKVKRKY